MIRHILKALGAAAVVSMSLSGSDAGAAGVRTVPGTGCVKSGPNAGVAGLVTQICGYVSDPDFHALTADSIFVDFDRQLSQSATARACRRGFNNATFNCTAPTAIPAATGSVDVSVGLWTGLVGVNDVWDYFSVEVQHQNLVGAQTQTVRMWGIGVNNI